MRLPFRIVHGFEDTTRNFEYLEQHAAMQGKLSVTGSRGGNVALANLLTALATEGLIIDNTTP